MNCKVSVQLKLSEFNRSNPDIVSYLIELIAELIHPVANGQQLENDTFCQDFLQSLLLKKKKKFDVYLSLCKM